MVAIIVVVSVICIIVIIAIIVYIKQYSTTKQTDVDNTGMALSNKVYCELILLHSVDIQSIVLCILDTPERDQLNAIYYYACPDNSSKCSFNEVMLLLILLL